MNLNEIQEKMSRLKNWGLEGNSITYDRFFGSFKGAIEFVNKIAEVAEKHNHHPSITIDHKRVKLTLTTHDAGGLSDKDFMVAEEIDNLGN